MALDAKRKTQNVIRKLVPSLLDWFAQNARDLPWRRTRDPYAIWVSEVMLQQTQVKTVIPYWQRWMRELPTIHSVAIASPARLHKLWEGLGYYHRVRHLQKAAQQLITRYGGHFPENFDDLLALPGVGRYTAGAIASIAFNQPRPVLDGNVIRVLTRVFGIATNPRAVKTNARLWQIATELVVHATRHTQHVAPCSHLNQSLMELGALVCTPRAPQCGLCPANHLCVARKLNRQEQLPRPGKRPKTVHRRVIAFVVERAGKFLVRQRPAGVVNAHLWEFPNFEVGANAGRARRSARAAAPPTETDPRSVAPPCRQDNFSISSTKPLCTLKHSITRYRINLEAWRASFRKPPSNLAGVWLTLPQLQDLAFTSAHQKLLRAVAADASPRRRRPLKVGPD